MLLNTKCFVITCMDFDHEISNDPADYSIALFGLTLVTAEQLRRLSSFFLGVCIICWEIYLLR